MKIKMLLVGLLLSAAQWAMAQSVDVRNFDFGTIKETAVFNDIAVSGSFDHKFKFTLGGVGLNQAEGGIVGLDLLGDLAGQFRYGVGASPVWSAWSSYAPVPSNVDGVFSLNRVYTSLTVGQTYWAEFRGDASYANYSVTLAPAVPEPETWAMLFAGLGLMGAVARRRKV